MKIEVKNFYDLTKEQQGKIIDDFIENGGSADYLNDKFSRVEVNAEVAVDEDFVLYDIRVFDPFHLVKANEFFTVYTNYDGWSNWLFDYRDNAGNTVDTIMEDYDGELQEFDGELQGI